MKILKCDLCNATKEIPASHNERVDFFWIDIKQYDGLNIGDEVQSHAHICPDCFTKIRMKIQQETEEA